MSRYMATTSWFSRFPAVAFDPNGPTEPATRQASPPAERASFTPSVRIEDNLSAAPYGSSLNRLAPKVLVSRMSAPAVTYSTGVRRPGGVGQVQLVEAAVDEDPLVVEEGTHGAVAYQHPPLQFIE